MGTHSFLILFQVIDALHKKLCVVVSWFTLCMVLITLLVVVLRYGFNMGWIALQESVMYLHAGVFMLGAAHTLRANEHVRVDVFYRRFSSQLQAWIDILGGVLLLLPVNIFILVLSWNYVANSWQLMEGSPEAGGLPLVFALKSLILLFCLTMCLQGLSEIGRNVLRLKMTKGGQA